MQQMQGSEAQSESLVSLIFNSAYQETPFDVKEQRVTEKLTNSGLLESYYDAIASFSQAQYNDFVTQIQISIDYGLTIDDNFVSRLLTVISQTTYPEHGPDGWFF